MPRRFTFALTALLLLLFVYESVARTLIRPLVPLPSLVGDFIGQTLILFLFSFTHAVYALGWRHTLVFFAASAVISWTFEQVGVATGIVYGAYHYTEVLGPKLGHVPLLIPIAWFMMIYPSNAMANSIMGNGNVEGRRRAGGIIGASILSAMIVTAWDLIMDPLLSGPTIKAWIWEQGGPYFGIPLRNYFGWALTTFTVYMVYRLFERGVGPCPMGPATALVKAMPLIAYGSVMISTSLENEAKAMVVIGVFAMGIPLLAAVFGLASDSRHPRS